MKPRKVFFWGQASLAWRIAMVMLILPTTAPIIPCLKMNLCLDMTEAITILIIALQLGGHWFTHSGNSVVFFSVAVLYAWNFAMLFLLWCLLSRYEGVNNYSPHVCAHVCLHYRLDADLSDRRDSNMARFKGMIKIDTLSAHSCNILWYMFYTIQLYCGLFSAILWCSPQQAWCQT